jgi:desulfoferrodoxin-like iron-binding protein
MKYFNYFIAVIFFTVFAVSCNQMSEKKDNKDTVVEKEVILNKPSNEDYKKLIVNRDTFQIKDAKKPTDFELKHTPEIIIGDVNEKGLTKVSVSIGSKGIIHPSIPEHWIDFVEVKVDDSQIEKIINAPGENTNKAEFYLNLKNAKIINCTIGCNLHGIWSNSLKIK